MKLGQQAMEALKSQIDGALEIGMMIWLLRA